LIAARSPVYPRRPSLRDVDFEEGIDLVEAAGDAATRLENDKSFNKAVVFDRWIKNRAAFARA